MVVLTLAVGSRQTAQSFPASRIENSHGSRHRRKGIDNGSRKSSRPPSHRSFLGESQKEGTNDATEACVRASYSGRRKTLSGRTVMASWGEEVLATPLCLVERSCTQ